MRIYLDHNATTPLHPAVAELTAQVARDVWGNASSVHHFGQQAKAVLDVARGQVADLVGADAAEIDVHWRRHGKRQRGDPRRGRGPGAGRAPTPRDDGHRARGGAEHA